MKKLILVTVGTSTLDKCRDKKKPDDLKTVIKQLDKPEFYNKIKGELKESLLNFAQQFDIQPTKNFREFLSAEMASLLEMEILKDIGKLNEEDKIVLLHSHTTDGKICAEVNADVLCQIRQNCPEVVEVEGLNPDSAEDFVNKGLNNLLQKTEEFLKNYKSSEWKKFINITGGYKGAIPAQTLQAILWYVPIVYLFENSDLVIMYAKETNDGYDFYRGTQNKQYKIASIRGPHGDES